MKKKRTKLIATIGPSSQSVATLEKMMRVGMDVARLNFSHGSHASHRGLIRAIRSASRKAKCNTAILADLQGPKIRLATLPSPVRVKRGDRIELPVGFPKFGTFLKKGGSILLDDGRVTAEYLSGKGETIFVKVTSGGELSSHVGLAVPGLKLKDVSTLTQKDKEDAIFAMGEHVDWLVQSFVTKASDVAPLRRLILAKADAGFSPKIMVKIERAEAVQNARAIIKVADGIMIGRGDLGLDLPVEKVPIAQKKIIALCREAGKPVVVATHMLESMTSSPRPTRAEVSDVANAVIDHTDAVMLSGETAKGAYPVETVSVMARTVAETEASVYDDIVPVQLMKHPTKEQAFAFMLAELVYAKRIKHLVVSLGDIGLIEALSLYRPEVPVFVLGTEASGLRQELLRWSVEPVRVSETVLNGEPGVLVKFLQKQRQVTKGSTVTVIGYRGSIPVFTTVKV